MFQGCFEAHFTVTVLVVLLGGVGCDCFLQRIARYPLQESAWGFWNGSGPTASRCLTVLSSVLIG